MNVKAQGLLNAGRYIEETYGVDVLAEVLRQCTPSTRARYAEGIAINWHPLVEFTDLLVAAQRVTGEPLIGEGMGAAGARANTRGILLRLAMLLSSPENVLRRAATLWRQFNDAGELTLGRFEPGLIEVELTGIPPVPRVFCDTLTGWAREILTSAGAKNATAKHTLCKSNHDARCVWLTRWSGTSE